MTRYVTHHFAHIETLSRAEKWLLQLGFDAGQIEVHRVGVPWISVLVRPDQSDEARMVFEAAELTDPEGWPSFWEMAQMPHPHMDEIVVDTHLVHGRETHKAPVAFHPKDWDDASERAVKSESNLCNIHDAYASYL